MLVVGGGGEEEGVIGIGISWGVTSDLTLWYIVPIIFKPIALFFKVSLDTVGSVKTLSHTSLKTLSTSNLEPLQIACKPCIIVSQFINVIIVYITFVAASVSNLTRCSSVKSPFSSAF